MFEYKTDIIYIKKQALASFYNVFIVDCSHFIFCFSKKNNFTFILRFFDFSKSTPRSTVPGVQLCTGTYIFTTCYLYMTCTYMYIRLDICTYIICLCTCSTCIYFIYIFFKNIYLLCTTYCTTTTTCITNLDHHVCTMYVCTHIYYMYHIYICIYMYGAIARSTSYHCRLYYIHNN